VSSWSESVVPALRRWSHDAAPDEARTIVVRVSFSASEEEVIAGLGEVGATVESAGAGAVICRVAPAMVEPIAALPWVLAVEEPRELGLRSGPPGSSDESPPTR
jgi:hypothetical protein